MRRLVVVAVAAVAGFLVACFPVGSPNGTPFEQAVAAHANEQREANGVPGLPWSNALANDAQYTVDNCWATDLPSLEACHNITAQPEDLIVWSGCDESDQRAVQTVYLWMASYGHKIFLLDQAGWTRKSAAGVGSSCHNDRQYIAWAGR